MLTLARNARGQFLKGDKEMLEKLRKIAAKAPSLAAAALYHEGERVMRRAKSEFVPIDLGTLKNSGLVDPPVVQAGQWVVRLSFGGAASEYALAVHEHLSEHSPYSWRNARNPPVKFHPAGRGPKYLEKPLMDAKNGLNKRIAEKMLMVFRGL